MRTWIFIGFLVAGIGFMNSAFPVDRELFMFTQEQWWVNGATATFFALAVAWSVEWIAEGKDNGRR